MEDGAINTLSDSQERAINPCCLTERSSRANQREDPSITTKILLYKDLCEPAEPSKQVRMGDLKRLELTPEQQFIGSGSDVPAASPPDPGRLGYLSAGRDGWLMMQRDTPREGGGRGGERDLDSGSS